MASAAQCAETCISSHLERKTTVTTKQRTSISPGRKGPEVRPGRRQTSGFTGREMSWVPGHRPWSHRGLRGWEQHRPVLEHHGMRQACAQGAEGLDAFRGVLSEPGALGLVSKEGCGLSLWLAPSAAPPLTSRGNGCSLGRDQSHLPLAPAPAVVCSGLTQRWSRRAPEGVRAAGPLQDVVLHRPLPTIPANTGI